MKTDAEILQLYPLPGGMVPLKGLYLQHDLHQRANVDGMFVYANFICALYYDRQAPEGAGQCFAFFDHARERCAGMVIDPICSSCGKATTRLASVLSRTACYLRAARIICAGCQALTPVPSII
jgi:hypothetical protein